MKYTEKKLLKKLAYSGMLVSFHLLFPFYMFNLVSRCCICVQVFCL